MWLRIALAVIIVAGTGGGVWFFQAQERSVRGEVEEGLSAVAELKVNQLTTWRSERLGDAAVLSEDPLLANAIAEWLEEPTDAGAAQLLARFRSVADHYDFSQVALLEVPAEPGGAPRIALATAGPSHRLSGELAEALAAALAERSPVFTGLHAGPDGLASHIDLVVPIVAEGAGASPRAAILLRTDLRDFLYPYLQTWPIPSRTAETLLVRRDGDSVLFLNELRHQSGTAFTLRIPLSRKDLPAVMAVEGAEGVVRGRDYRGVEVLAAVRPVPGTPWFMVAKVDASEALSDWRWRSRLILGFMLGLVAAAASAAVVVWQRNAKAQYRTLYQAEAALKHSEQRYRLLADHTLDVIWQMDLEARFTYVNPAIEEMFGYTPEEFVGTSLADHCDEKELEKMLAVIAHELEHLNDHTGIVLETVMRHRDGREVPVEIHGRILTDEQGTPLSIQGTTRDVSERKRLEVQLLQSQKLEAVGRLAGGVAHDFNNMLQAILGFSELALAEAGPGSPLEETLREIRAAAQRSADLTRQLLGFARRQVVQPTVVDLNESVAGMLKMLRPLIGEDIELMWRPGAGLGAVFIDPVQVDQVLTNLVTNARDAISGVGRIVIETANARFDQAYCDDHPDFSPGDFVMITVIDDGRGMEREALDHIFEPFYTTKATGEGTGLGLATVYGIARQNQGFVNAYSEPGNGTIIKVYLPRHRAAEAEAPSPAATGAVPSGSETVLVVEDEPAIRRLCGSILERLGYSVLTAATPTEALEIAEAHRQQIALLLTDVIMPEMTGRELALTLQGLNPGLRCLYMSGYTADVIAHRGVLDHEVEFIQKPFSRSDLAARVREVLDRADPHLEER